MYVKIFHLKLKPCKPLYTRVLLSLSIITVAMALKEFHWKSRYFFFDFFFHKSVLGGPDNTLSKI